MLAETIAWLRPRRPRLSVILLSLFLIYLFLHRLGPAIGYYIDVEPHPQLRDTGTCRKPDPAGNLTANLIVASTSHDDTSWTSHIPIAGLRVLRYISNSPSARYHPPIARGREALMYFTYLYDFYDKLPDVSIFVHAEETPWHVEGTLLQNTTFALSQLNFQQVLRRQYFNLRVTWRAGCPAWINTSKTLDDWNLREEPYMKGAWKANFGDDARVPEILAGPCCSQFAVSRGAIRRQPREQYRKSMEWLMKTDLDDQIAGRAWEHMWPYLFKSEAKDCEPEIPSLCDLYGLCFDNEQEVVDYKELWEERERLKEDMSFFQAIWKPEKAAQARLKMLNLRKEIERKFREVWLRSGCVKNGHD